MSLTPRPHTYQKHSDPLNNPLAVTENTLTHSTGDLQDLILLLESFAHKQ